MPKNARITTEILFCWAIMAVVTIAVIYQEQTQIEKTNSLITQLSYEK